MTTLAFSNGCTNCLAGDHRRCMDGLITSEGATVESDTKVECYCIVCWPNGKAGARVVTWTPPLYFGGAIPPDFFDNLKSCPKCGTVISFGSKCYRCPPDGMVLCPVDHSKQPLVGCLLCKGTRFVEELT